MMLQLVLLLSALLIAGTLDTTNGQECLQANDKNGIPPIQQHGSARVIPPGYQAIIPSYRFQCYGRITRWMLATRCSLNCSTDIELQVWRPSINASTSESQRYYSKIGANRFTYRTKLSQFVPQQQIEVIPGDVLGFQVFDPGDIGHEQGGDFNGGKKCDGSKYSDAEKGDSGVVILNFINNRVATNEEVWYARVRDSITGSVSIGCRGILDTLTDAAPVISASILRVNSTARTSTQSYHTHDTIPSTQKVSTKDGGSSGTKMTIIAVNTTVAVLLTASITIVVVICCIVFVVRRRRKTCTPRMTRVSQSEAQVKIFYNRDITMMNNEAYGTVDTFTDSGGYVNDYYDYDYI